MKRIVFLFALLYGATLMAQNKAVAVTEVVDKEDKVSYATEIMVRTRLTAAISMKQGYTAYDRVDLQSIMNEQNFQRTGLVDDATIKRLGEMTGASLILIPEVAMSDDGKIYVAVKMLDVTTAQTLMSTGELMGNSSAEVEEGCRALTAKVLGVRSGSQSTAVVADEPVTLFGYIHVFPTDIGEFQTLPAQLLSAINKKATYGYDSWRLPTTEELSIMRANSHLIPNFRNVDYLCSDSSVKGLARLVTTDMSVSEKKEVKAQDEMIRKKAIYNLLDIHSDFNNYMILDTIVVCAHKQLIIFGEREELRPPHPNHNFSILWYYGNESITRNYLNYVSDPNIEIILNYDKRERPRERLLNNEPDIYVYSYDCYLTLTNKSGEIISKQLHKKWTMGFYSNSNDLVDDWFITDEYSCYYLYSAPLPSEQSIIQEMQNIRRKLEM